MSNYALDTPIMGKVWVPETDIPFGKVAYAPNHPSEVSQAYRAFDWLFHNPQLNAIFPLPSNQNSRDSKPAN
jgi:hypothetical protein